MTNGGHGQTTMFLKRYLPFLLIGLVVVALYAHTVHAPFYLDDHYAIGENKAVKDLWLALKGILSSRGLGIFTFALNYRFGEFNVAGYHVVNISLHVAAGCVALLLLRRIFPQRPWLQLFGALIFVAHPLQTQGVTYVAQRMASLSALLFLLAIYLFLRAREFLAAGGAIRDREHLLWYGAALLMGGLAILAKENAVVLPVALILFTRCFTPAAAPRRRELLGYVAPFAIFPALAVVVYYVWPMVNGTTLNTLQDSALLRSMEGNSPLHYLVTQFSVLWIYLRMFFLPYGQALDHGYPVARELLTLRSIAGFSGLIGLGVLGWRLRKSQPALTFGIGWFFLTLIIESSVIPLDPLFEHRLYLPMFGMSVCATALLALIPQPTWQLAAGGAIVLVLALLTWRRNALWNDPVAFYEDNFRVASHNERVCYNLGQKYMEIGRFDEAERLIRESIFMNPKPHFGYLALKQLYIVQGRLGEAVDMLRYGLEHADTKGPLYNELASIYGKQGDFAMAIALLQEAIAADPKVIAPYINLAQMALFVGDRELALKNLLKALEINPSDADAGALLNTVRGQ